MAKILKKDLQNRMVNNFNDKTPEEKRVEHTEALIQQFKRETKKNLTLDYWKMHQYHMTNKEKKLYKEKLNRMLTKKSKKA